MNPELKNRIGLTLVEILIVLAVIALLATMVIGIASSIYTKAKEKATKATITLLESALEEYKDFENEFPMADTQDPNLNCEKLYTELNRIPSSRVILEKLDDSAIKNKYGAVDSPPEIYDSWGIVLNYIYDPNHTNFPWLSSAGPDREHDNLDDISNK